MVLGDGVDESEFFSDGIAGVGEHRERQAVLVGHEVALALDLRTDGDHERAVLAEVAVEIAPGFELGDAVGAPAAAKEFDDQRTEGEQVARSGRVCRWRPSERTRGLGADGKDSFLDAGGEEFFHGFSPTARRSGCTRLRVLEVISSSWSCRGVMDSGCSAFSHVH